MIAKSGACGLREGGDHRGKLERDLEHVEAFVVEKGSGVRVRRDGSGGRGGCVFGREIQSGAPFKRNGLSAVLTRMDGACLNAWSPAPSRPKRSNRRDRRSDARGAVERARALGGLDAGSAHLGASSDTLSGFVSGFEVQVPRQAQSRHHVGTTVGIPAYFRIT